MYMGDNRLHDHVWQPVVHGAVNRRRYIHVAIQYHLGACIVYYTKWDILLCEIMYIHVHD